MLNNRPADTITRMAAKKKPTNDGDKHKPSRMFRVPLRMAELLDEIAEEELGTTAAEHHRTAIREYLQKKGKLPKPIQQ